MLRNAAQPSPVINAIAKAITVMAVSYTHLDRLLPLLFAGICLLSRLGLGEQETEMAYAVLPVDHIVAFLFLFLGVLLLNSLWFQKSEGHTLFGTLAVFALYLLLREFSLLFLALSE